MAASELKANQIYSVVKDFRIEHSVLKTSSEIKILKRFSHPDLISEENECWIASIRYGLINYPDGTTLHLAAADPSEESDSNRQILVLTQDIGVYIELKR